MAYKRYIKRGKKLYGPYIYHSKKQNGSVTSEYRGKVPSNRNLILLIVGLSLLFLLIFISTFGIISSSSTFAKKMIGLTVEEELFNIKIIDFESPAKLGEFFDFTYFIKSMVEINNSVEVQFWIEKEEEIITSGLDTLYLGSFEEKTETTKIFLPSNVDFGTYTFVVQVDHEIYSARSERTIEIKVSKGIVAITPIDIKGFKVYGIIALIILGIIILSLIFYLERKKIKAEILKQESWIKKHKISVVAFTLFILLGILTYSLNLFNTLFSFAKTPSFAYVLKIALVVFVLLIAIFIARKMNLFEKFKGWRIKRMHLSRLKEKEKKILEQKKETNREKSFEEKVFEDKVEKPKKEIRETFSFKPTILLKFKNFVLNSIKSLEIFESKKRKEIARERKEEEASRTTERTMEEIYEEVFYLLKKIFGKKSYAEMIQDFQKILVGKWKFTKKDLKILKSLEENKRREFKLAKPRVHRNIDNLRNEAEVLIKKLTSYSQNLDKKEISRTSIGIHDYWRKKQISYLRGLHNIKGMFFKEKRKIINFIKELENKELMRIKGEEDKKVKNISEQKKEKDKRKIFKKKALEDFLPFGSEIDTEISLNEEPKKRTQSMKKIKAESTRDIIENTAEEEKIRKTSRTKRGGLTTTECKAWCMRCKAKVDVKNPVEGEYDLGTRGKRRNVHGICPKCNTKVSAILKSK